MRRESRVTECEWTSIVSDAVKCVQKDKVDREGGCSRETESCKEEEMGIRRWVVLMLSCNGRRERDMSEGRADGRGT